MVVLSVSNISKSFDSGGIKNISFTVSEGEILGLIGPNGAGKTTTLRIICQIYEPDTGTVSFFGSKIDKSKIGYLAEERGIYLNSSALEFISYIGTLKGLTEKEANTRSMELLKKLGLSDRLNEPLKNVSKGMKQKVQIAASLINKPKLIILDEPFSGLDPINLELIKEIIMTEKKNGSAIILSTHIMDQAEKLADKIIMLNKGQIVLSGLTSDLISKKKIIHVKSNEPIPLLLSAQEIKSFDDGYLIYLKSTSSIEEFMTELLSKKIKLTHLEIKTQSLHEIFLEVVR